MTDHAYAGHLGPNQRRALQLLAARNDGMTRAELQAAIGIHDLRSMQTLIKTLRQRKLIHISAWRYQSAGKSCPACRVFAHGAGKDTPKPTALGAAACKRRYRDRVGHSLFNRVTEARKRGSSSIVIDGITVWKRGEGFLNHAHNVEK